MALQLQINGETRSVDTPPETPLLWVLRDHLGLKGTKFGCGVGVCGICTVLADGEALHACMAPAGELRGRHITTIEGLAAMGHPVLSAWIAEQVPQCGYCQPGQIMTAAALLERHPRPDDGQITEALDGVLCRCGTYQRIRRGVHRAAALAPGEVNPLPAPPPAAGGVNLDQWIRIDADGGVTVQINHAEMGQGVSSALAALVAEELEVDLARVRTEFAPARPRYRNPLFDEQTTGGSTSVRGEWEPLSRAGAGARMRLVTAAARRWRVPEDECAARDGAVIHRPTDRRLGYAEVAAAAAAIAPPRHLRLKSPEECRLLGRPFPRLDLPAMAGGRAVYGLDVSLPDLRVATVVRCPVPGGRLRSHDAKDALAVPGVEAVVPVARGVAVVAADTWAALQGRAVLTVDWDEGPDSRLDNAALTARVDAALAEHGAMQQRAGRAASVLARAPHVLEAHYTTAPLAHATLEPMNCNARVSDEGCEVWLGTQSPEGARTTAARVSGLPLGKVQVHSQYLGGGFGRRAESDMVAEAVELARGTGWPVQVIWTRADDFQHDYYRPLYRARLRATLDADGWPGVWWQRAASAPVAGEGHGELPYRVPDLEREFVAVEPALPAGAWRSVGAGQDAFAVESFVDELAVAAGRDPFQYRRALLAGAPRHRAVLELAAERAGWGAPRPPDRHQGIAVYACFGSYVAEVAEVSVADGRITVHRMVCAIDCGRTVNPDTVRAQIEGGVANGLSAALIEAVTVEGGRVRHSTFQDYPILTLAGMPTVDVHIVPSEAPPGGVGEPGVPPVAPAVANAVAAATGIRLRDLPLRLPPQKGVGDK